MRLCGNISKDKRWWLAEIPALDLMTQAKTKKELLGMVQDLVETMANTDDFHATVILSQGDQFEVSGNHDGVLVALFLRRLRAQEGITLSEVARRLGAKSKNTYARYEQGASQPTIGKLGELVRAITGEDFTIGRSNVLATG